MSVLRAEPKQVTLESNFKVGRRLMDLAVHPRQHWLATIDSQADELVLLRYQIDQSERCQLTVTARHSAPKGLLRLDWLPDGRLMVSSAWSRQISLWRVDSAGPPQLALDSTIELPFAPCNICVTPNDQAIVVADAFGGNLALIRLNPLHVSVVQIPGHNIRGLTMSHDQTTVLVAHQMLNDFIPTTRDHVFWGNVVSSMLRSISLDQLSSPTATNTAPAVRRVHGSLFPLGQEGHAAGDPSEVTITDNGYLCICLSGVGEVAIRPTGQRRFRRIPVGRGPSSQTGFGNRLAVANRFEDTVVILQLKTGKILQRIPLGPTPAKETEAERGERLFFDAKLSLDGWYSCHSCHTEGHTCGLLNDNFGDETMGAPKRIPTLLGVGTTGPYAWNGRHHSLQSQIRSSLQRTMHTNEEASIHPADLSAIEAYLRTLQPPPDLTTSRGRPLNAASIDRGSQQFHQLGCADCHIPPAYTSTRTYDVGLHDEKGQQAFNPPSLRGLSHRRVLLHDGRYTSLAELLRSHPTPDGLEIGNRERQDLLTFLRSL